MKYQEGKADELKTKMWKAMADSPYVFLELDGRSDTAIVMTAQLDKDADSAIWFYSHKDSDLAAMGPATVTFSGKGHNMFARIAGTLVEETSRERFEHFWSNFVEAWYEGGKDDPNMLFMRLDLGKAEIWSTDLGALTTVKMAMGKTVLDEAEQEHLRSTQL